MSAEPRISIGDNHRSHISITLVLLDEMLGRFEPWIRGETAKGPLFEECDDLSEEQKRALLTAVAATRSIMADLRDDLELPKKVESVARAIWSQCSCFWEYLVELESKYLQRYGELPADFAAYFDPKVKALIERLDAISDITRSAMRPQEKPPTSPADDESRGGKS